MKINKKTKYNIAIYAFAIISASASILAAYYVVCWILKQIVL